MGAIMTTSSTPRLNPRSWWRCRHSARPDQSRGHAPEASEGSPRTARRPAHARQQRDDARALWPYRLSPGPRARPPRSGLRWRQRLVKRLATKACETLSQSFEVQEPYCPAGCQCRYLVLEARARHDARARPSGLSKRSRHSRNTPRASEVGSACCMFHSFSIFHHVPIALVLFSVSSVDRARGE